MSISLRSRLHTSLYRRRGRPVARDPAAISPYRISFGIRPSFIRLVWPSQRSLRCDSKAYMLGTLAWLRISWFDLRSSQVVPRIRRKQSRWNVFMRCSCDIYVVQLSLPYSKVLKIQALYTDSLVANDNLPFSHTLFDSLDMAAGYIGSKVDPLLPLAGCGFQC